MSADFRRIVPRAPAGLLRTFYTVGRRLLAPPPSLAPSTPRPSDAENTIGHRGKRRRNDPFVDAPYSGTFRGNVRDNRRWIISMDRVRRSVLPALQPRYTTIILMREAGAFNTAILSFPTLSVSLDGGTWIHL